MRVSGLCALAMLLVNSWVLPAADAQQFARPIQGIAPRFIAGRFIEQEEADAAEGEQDEGEADEEKDDSPVTGIEQPAPVNPREVIFHLSDGNVITGDLLGDGVTVETEFGSLAIPVEKLIGMRPGLNSKPEVLAKLESLIKELGDQDFNVREQAHKQLVLMGPKYLMEIYQYGDEGNAERRRHLKEVREELETQSMEMSEDVFESEQTQQVAIRGDSVTTQDFTIVGKISQSTFQVKSKYGDLTVQLADIVYMDREMTGGTEVRRKLTVAGSNMIGRSMKSSGIRVQKGDIIEISAKGQITMSPWGDNRMVGPEGSSNYSNNGEFQGGSLVMQISEGKSVYVGKKNTIKAYASGVLKFGVAIPSDYMNYNYPGDYKLNIYVKSK